MERTKVKFSTENKEFIVELKETVANYFKSNNISKYGSYKIVLKTIFMFSLYFIPYLLALLGVVSSFGAVLSMFILMGFGKAGIGMSVMHDANHRSYSKHKSINKWMGNTLFLLGGFPTNWRRQHNNLHHGFTNIEGHDEDIKPVANLLRFSPNTPLRKVHRFQYLYAWFFYGLMTIMWATTKDFKQLKRFIDDGMPLTKNKTYGKLLTELIFGKTLYYLVFLVTPLLVLPFAWYWILLFFLTMHFVSGFTLTVIFQTAHVVPDCEFPLPNDTGNIENSFAIHQMLNTSNFAPNNRVLTWLIGGLNHQIEHHLFPGISHVHYRNISKFVEEGAKKHGLPYHVQPGFFRAVWAHGKMLKQLGRPVMA